MGKLVIPLTEREAAQAEALGAARFEASSTLPTLPNRFAYDMTHEEAFRRNLHLFAMAEIALARVTGEPWDDLVLPNPPRRPSVGPWYLHARGRDDYDLVVCAHEGPPEAAVILATVNYETRTVMAHGWRTFGDVLASPHRARYRFEAQRLPVRMEDPHLVPQEEVFPMPRLPGLAPSALAARCLCRHPQGYPQCSVCGGVHDQRPRPLFP